MVETLVCHPHHILYTVPLSSTTLSGSGELGARVATLWKSKFPNAQITLKANRNDPEREEYWKSLGFIPFQDDGKTHKYENVLFAAPPGSGGDGRTYANEVENALANFVLPNGTFVFTSSGGVFTENSGKMVDESSDVVSLEEPWTTRSQGILSAEKAVLKNSG